MPLVTCTGSVAARREGALLPVAVWGKADRPDKADTARRLLLPHSALSVHHQADPTPASAAFALRTRHSEPHSTLDNCSSGNVHVTTLCVHLSHHVHTAMLPLSASEPHFHVPQCQCLNVLHLFTCPAVCVCPGRRVPHTSQRLECSRA